MSYAGGFPAKKNVEFLLIFPIYDSDGDLVTGAATLDSEISKDGGAFTDCTNEATEIDTSGIYALTLTPTEMNADVVAIITKTTTGDAKTTASVIYTSSKQIDALATEDKQDIIDGIVDIIKADLVDGGRLDLLIDAIKARTDINATEAKQNIIDTIVDAIKVETDKLNNMIEADDEDFRYTQNALEQAPVGEGLVLEAIADAVWNELKAGHTIPASYGDFLDVKISTVGPAAGAGAITWVYTLTDADTSNPIADADIWVTTDEAGTNVIASGKTDQYGKVTFYLDAGTVYVWRQKSGWDFDNPDTEVVS